MLNKIQQQVIQGSLLGDGGIWNNVLKLKYKCKFQITQSQTDKDKVDKRSYLDWFSKIFEDYSSSVKSGSFKGVNDKIYHRYVFTTHIDELWDKYEKLWYKLELQGIKVKRTKVIPNNIKLTPLTLCVWHMEDGSNNQADGNIELNTQGFTIEEVDFLISRLKEDLGIQSKPKKGGHKKGQYKIYVGIKSYFDFIEMIKPHVEWDCFKYKTEISYNKIAQIGENHSQAKLKNKDIDQIFQLKEEGWLQKDIAKKFKVSKAMISRTLSGDMHKHSGKAIKIKKKPRITKVQKAEVIALIEQGMFQKDIAERLNINQSTVSRIRRDKCQG